MALKTGGGFLWTPLPTIPVASELQPGKRPIKCEGL